MDNKPLSASLIKTLTGCSWQYYCKYVLKMPDTTNEGALRGTLCHTIFECLGKKRHKKHFTKMKKSGTIWSVPAIDRMVKSYCRKYSLMSSENLEMLDLMIIAGLNYDFFGRDHAKHNPTEAHDEIDFDITVDEKDKSYRIRGFIDKLFLFKKEKLALIRDFKSSKAVYEGDEVDDNIQDMIYRLAIRKLFPEYNNQKMQFVFLRFNCEDGGDGIVATPDISDEELEGFEYYLTEIQKQVNNFSEDDAKADYAYKKGFPDKEEGFTKRLLCGFGKKQGELKKDGNLKWSCAMKWKMEYYKVFTKEGVQVRGLHVTDKDEIKKYKRLGYTLSKESYPGCPCFNYATERKDVFL